MTHLVQHLHVAVRSWRRAPGFAVTATLTLALGIGLSTAVFTVADALLVRDLPVHDEERLVVLWGESRDGRFSNVPVALRDVQELERRSRSLGAVAFFGFRGATPSPIRIGDREHPAKLSLVSGNYFDVLGSAPVLGRTLRPEDDVEGAAPVVVLSHRAWQQRLGADSSVVGRPITLLQSGREVTIVGIMPPGLDYPHGTDMWLPLVAYGAAGGFLETVTGELDMLARLRPGVRAEQAEAELTTYLGRPDAPAMQRDVRGVAHSFRDIVLGDTKPALIVVVCAAALLLLITCVNVANLLLVRALGRVKEFVVRAALGARRGHLVAGLLTESALLSLAGGLLGIVLAFASVRAFVVLAPQTMPRVAEIRVSGTMFLVALAVTLVTILLAGLGPALFSSRADARDTLRSGTRGSGGGRVRAIAETLVVAQVALACMSLAGAAVVLRSFVALQEVELSFDPDELVVAELVLRQDRFADPSGQASAVERMTTTARALPGVRDVSRVMSVPFVGAGGGIDGRLRVPGESAEEAARHPILSMELAAPNHFAMFGTPMLRGRGFRDDDRQGTPPVVIVSQSAAAHYWPGADPLGKRLAMRDRELTVVGVVPDLRYRELQVARATVYFPIAQSPFGSMVPSILLVRTSQPLASVEQGLRRAARESHPGITLVGVTPLHAMLQQQQVTPRLNAVLLALFAGAAVALAGIGLFAVIGNMVQQRSHELGVRLALGATATDLHRMVLGRGMLLALVGATAGIAGALASNRMLSALLFGVTPSDAVTLAAVALLMLAVSAAASVIPARWSMRIDPASALRSAE